MGRNGTPGASTASRLASRAERSALSRKAVAGGEVFQGPLASRALKALGARAMTVDRSIIVGEGFSESKPEDAALFAHEQHHVQESGGRGGHQGRDAEEVGARAAEAMVFHRMAGGYESGYEQGAGPGRSANPWADHTQNSTHASSGTQGSSDTPETVRSAPDPARGYETLKAQGYSHDDVVQEIARRCLSALDEAHQVRGDRWAEHKGWT